jgi:hypothetical protein
VQVVPAVETDDVVQAFTEDGHGLLLYSATPWQAQIFRVEVATGKRTLLQTIEPHQKAGSVIPLRLAYAERSKTYVYGDARILGTLYVVNGLE